MSSVDRLFSKSTDDMVGSPIIFRKPKIWEKLLVAMATWQTKTGRNISRKSMFLAKTRISGRVTLKASLSLTIHNLQKDGYIERVERAVYRVTRKGMRYARKVKKEKNIVFGD